jgi:hypothetical protein
MRAIAAAGALLAGLAGAGAAGAVEREHQIGLEAGVPMLVVNGPRAATLSGAGAGIHYTYGITDAVNLVADAGWAALPLGAPAPHTSLATLSNLNLGVAYVLDVLRWVPWGAIEAGGYALTGDPVGGTQVLPGFALAVGCDYRFDRSWAAGLVLRQHMLFTDTSTFPSLTQALLRVGYTWGW